MAMATEEKSDGLVGSSSAASTQSQRQRFYIELKPGETTIVSWRKLLREGKTIDHCPSSTNGTLMGSSSTGTNCSSAHETPKRALDYSSEVGECDDSFVRNGRLDHQSTSSGSQLLKKRSVEMTDVEGKKSNDPFIKHVRLEDRSSRDTAKTPMLLDQPFTQSSLPPVVKDRHLNSPPSSDAHAPVVMYKTKSATFSSKSNYSSPVNAMGTASVFPLKTKQSGLEKTGKSSSERSRTKGGILRDPPDVVCQHSAGKCVPLQTNPRCRKLMTEDEIEVSSKNQLCGKGSGSGELLAVGSTGYNYSLQHSMSMKGASAAVNGVKPAKPFHTVLEKAIGELEGTVAESKSFKIEASDAHTSWLTIERELPLEVNLKLGQVARLVQSSKEGISKELVSCLVNIIGQLVHGKTLKRLLRKFVMLKLSAKKEKAEKFKAIKNVVSSQQVRAIDYPDVKEEAILGETYKSYSAMEDKLCDLYDLCVQGNSGDKGVEAQNLFIELEDLWPKGVMDHHKLRDAIGRAKSRRRLLVDEDQGKKPVKSGCWVSSMITDHNTTSDLVPSLKRKVTYSGNSCDLMSSPSGWTTPMKAAVGHPVVSAKASRLLPKAVRRHNFPAERKLKSSAALSPVGPQVPEKKPVKIRFSLKPQDGTHRCEEQAAMDKLNCSRVDAHLTWKASSFLG